LRPEDVFVCLDSALDEETKLRLQDGRNVAVDAIQDMLRDIGIRMERLTASLAPA